MTTTMRKPFDPRLVLGIFVALVVLFWGTSNAWGQFEGFTEPIRQIQLASDETGIIDELLVREGDLVSRDQVIVQLNEEMQVVQFELAEHLAKSDSNVLAAKQTYEKRMSILEQLKKLKQENFVNDNEVLRASMELDLAFSKWKSTEDEFVARKIEMRRAQIQLENRQIRAPFDAVVAEIHRRAGEFVSPINSEILTLVDDRQLYGRFNVPSSQVSEFSVGRPVTVTMENGQAVEGIVDFVGTKIDSQSGTVIVKVLIENSERQLRSGEACTLKS